MEREEEMLQAAADNFKVCRSSIVKSIERIWVTAFATGASWADRHQKDVWHDASEEPEGYNRAILCRDTKGNCWVENMFLLHITWNEFIRVEMVDKWAYIKDLLPKGCEK